MSRWLEMQAIAPGHNQEANLAGLHRLDPPFFHKYRRFIETEFIPYETRRMSAGRRLKRIGLPRCIWKFPWLSQKEFFLITSFIPEGQDDSFVTIRTLDSDTGEWYNYNATIQRPELSSSNWDGASYVDIEITFIDLLRL